LSRTARLALIAAFVVVVVAAFVIAKSGGDSDKSSPTTASTPTTATPTAPRTQTTAVAPKPAIPVIVVRNGKPVGGIKKLSYRVGDRVAFTVRSDVSDEIHVHGYDVMKDVESGGQVTFSFKAKIDGIFEVELESRGEQIAELKVQP
jgi:hypothetical protein